MSAQNATQSMRDAIERTLRQAARAEMDGAEPILTAGCVAALRRALALANSQGMLDSSHGAATAAQCRHEVINESFLSGAWCQACGAEVGP